MKRNDTPSRRAFVRSAAAAASVAGSAALAGCSMPGIDPGNQDTPAVKDEDRDPNSGEQPEHEESEESVLDADEIRLEAYREGWEGVEPADIEGQVNPRLELAAGTSYELTFENADGHEHNLQVRDSEKEPLESTDDVEEEGETASVTVEASEEMEWYACDYHGQRMQGPIEFPDDAGDQG